MFRRFHRLTAAGNMGKPTQGTEPKGRKIHEAVVNEIVSFLTDFATWPDLPPIKQ